MIQTAAEIPADLPALSDIEVVYVDSHAALVAAFDQGLNRDVEVRTSSPAMILDPAITVTQSDREIPPETVQELYRETTRWARTAYNFLLEEPELSDIALLVAQRILRFQTHVFKLMALQSEDFERPVAAVVIETSTPTDDAKLNAPYWRVLSINPQFVEIKVPNSSVELASPIAPPQPSFRDRLRFSDWQVKAYRLASLFWDRVPVASPLGTILVFNEGDLVKETAVHLVKRGYGLRHLQAPSIAPPTNAANTTLRRKIEPFLETCLSHWLTPAAIAPTVEYFMSELEATAAEFYSSLPAWRTKLDALGPIRPKAILANLVSGPAAAALGVVARERSLLLVAFQHGVADEVANDTDCAEFFHGSITADILFNFNREAASKTNKSPLTRGKAISIGMQRDHYRAAKLQPNSFDLPPIWYISTMLYVGNFQMLARGMGDLDSATYECALIDKILARLPHRVLYKPYPASRYADPDPINERAAAAANITLYEEAQDLRYLLANARIIVTARPTSTLGWCLTSDKPVVYIDIPGQPLVPEAREALASGLFLFDGTPPLDGNPLREFLSQPIEDIEQQWKERAPARRTMIERYIDGGNMNAGATAAKILTRADFKLDRIEI